MLGLRYQRGRFDSIEEEHKAAKKSYGVEQVRLGGSNMHHS